MSLQTIQRPAATRPAQGRAPARPEALSAPASRLGELLGLVAPPKRLSLDCFDTILWRRTATPVDVFYDLQHRPAFAARGLAPAIRTRAETLARQLQQTRHGSYEVNLAQIYRAAFPDLDDAEVEALSEDELAAEMEACYAFPGAVELLRDAARRGIPTMIVSDTYLTQAQLERLLAHCLPADAMAAIERVVVSNALGVSKTGGLFGRVLQRWPINAADVLHVGDNPRADQHAASAAGMRSVHILHTDDKLATHERMQSMALGLIEPRVRRDRSLPRPYHGVLSNAPDGLETPTQSVGYAALGPLMHAFAHFVLDERRALAEAGRKPKLLFLMRDAHLPKLACEVVAGGPVGAAVRISRFAAFAASFRTRGDVEHYVAQFSNPKYFDAMARQLQLPAKIADRVVSRANASRSPVEEFARQVMRDDVLKTIFAGSAAYRAKLRRYLEREAGIEAGDTLVFVDLGYQGTAQRLLEPVFREEWGIDVVGRYLLASRTPGWERSRRGLIDASWCDDRTIASIVPYVAVLENLCTSSDATVIDYTDDGEAVLDAQLIDEAQTGQVEAIQAEALRFVADAERFFGTAGHAPATHLRDAALGELVRLVFFPTRDELSQFGSFELDMNLGTQQTLRLHDTEAGLEGLRTRGLFFMENALDSMRLLRPAELHAAGIELSLALLAQHRFGLEIGVADASMRREPVRVIVMRGDQATQEQIEALHTHDGWFALHVPLGMGDVHAGLAFGERFRFVQVASVTSIPVSQLYRETEVAHTTDASSRLVLDGMTDRGEGLYECDSETSLMIVPPPLKAPHERLVARVVFRPIVHRQAAEG